MGGPSFDDLPFYSKLLEKQGFSRVVEFGASTGRLLIGLAEMVDFGVGLEIDPEYVEWARRTVKNQGFSHLDFHIADIGQALANAPPGDVVLAGWSVFQAMISDHQIAAFLATRHALHRRWC